MVRLYYAPCPYNQLTNVKLPEFAAKKNSQIAIGHDKTFTKRLVPNYYSDYSIMATTNMSQLQLISMVNKSY